MIQNLLTTNEVHSTSVHLFYI